MNAPKRVFVIDDDISVRKIVRLCLERLEGWSVYACGSTKALHHVRLSDCDAILLEIALMEMDGFDFFEQLQADPGTRMIPVALLTSKVMPLDYKRYRFLDIAGVIQKPFHPDTLGQQITEVLGWSDFQSSMKKAS